MKNNVRLSTVVGFVCLILVFILPLVAGGYWTFFLFQCIAATYLALSVDLVYSYAKILSFCQGLFFATGAYAAIYLASASPWSLFFVLLASSVGVAMLGALVGAILVRMQGDHSPIIGTVIIAAITQLAANAATTITGGEDGLSARTSTIGLAGFQLPLGADLALYYIAVGLLALLLVLSWVLRGTAFWIVLEAVGENATRAQHLGFNIRLRRLSVFAASAGVAGVGGAFSALGMQHVTTELTGLGLSLNAILWAVVGGWGVAFGPLLGVLVVYPVSELVATVFVYVEIIVGFLLIAVAMYFPTGIAGLLAQGSIRVGSLSRVARSMSYSKRPWACGSGRTGLSSTQVSSGKRTGTGYARIRRR